MGDNIEALRALAARIDNYDIGGNKNGKLLDTDDEITIFEGELMVKGYQKSEIKKIESEIQNFKEENGLAVTKTTTNPIAEAQKTEAAATQSPKTAKTDNKVYNKLLTDYNAEVKKAEDAKQIPEYKKIVDDIEAKQTSKNEETKKAIEMLRDQAKTDAYYKAVAINSGNIGKTKGKRRKAMRNMSEDKYFRDAIQDIKLDRKVLARREVFEARKDEISNVTREELEKDLSKHFLGIKTGSGKELAKKLFNAKDGRYKNGNNLDLRKLSDDILSRIGYNYQLDLDSDKTMAEITYLKTHLEEETGQTFTKNEVKRLVKYVDAKVGHRRRSLLGFGKNLLLGEAVGISSGALGGYKAKHGNLNVKQSVNMTVDVNTKQTITSALDKAGIEYTTSTAQDGVHVVISILQEVLKNDQIRNALTGALIGAGIGAIPALAYLAFGEETNEKSCVSVSDYHTKETKYTNIDEYKKHIDKLYERNPVKADAMKALAQYYYDEEKADGNTSYPWHLRFQDLIREMAGVGSKLNPEECLWFKYKALKTPEKPQEPVVQEQPKTYQVSDRCSDDEERTERVEKPEVEKVAWETLAARYDCLDLPLGYKTRLVKVMQSVNNDDYTLENLKKLTDISLSIKPKKKLSKMNPAEKEALKNEIRAKFQGVQGLDVEDYINNFFATTIGKQKIPTIKIDDNTECDYNPDITHNVKFVNGKPDGKSGHAGDEKTCTIYGDKTATIETSDGQTYTYGKNEKEQFKRKRQELDSQGYKGSGNADCYEK